MINVKECRSPNVVRSVLLRARSGEALYWASEPHAIPSPAGGRELFGDADVSPGTEIDLAPWFVRSIVG